MESRSRGRPRSFDRDIALDKAIRLFWRQGFEATSIRDLAAELEISVPSLYGAFGGKAQLFAEAVRVYDGKYGGFIDRALDEEPTAKQAAARILGEGPERYTRSGLPLGCLVASGDAGTMNSAVVEQMSKLRASHTATLAGRIRADIGAGLLPAETNARGLALYTMSVLNGIASSARDGTSRAQLKAAAQIALKAWD